MSSQQVVIKLGAYMVCKVVNSTIFKEMNWHIYYDPNLIKSNPYTDMGAL
jgi:hypothetical protein